MVKTTIKGCPGPRGEYTACYLLEKYSGRAFVGSASTGNCISTNKAIFWISYHSVNVFQVEESDYSKAGSWNKDSKTIFHIDRFIDIEVKEI